MSDTSLKWLCNENCTFEPLILKIEYLKHLPSWICWWRLIHCDTGLLWLMMQWLGETKCIYGNRWFHFQEVIEIPVTKIKNNQILMVLISCRRRLHRSLISLKVEVLQKKFGRNIFITVYLMKLKTSFGIIKTKT